MGSCVRSVVGFTVGCTVPQLLASPSSQGQGEKMRSLPGSTLNQAFPDEFFNQPVAAGGIKRQEIAYFDHLSIALAEQPQHAPMFIVQGQLPRVRGLRAGLR